MKKHLISVLLGALFFVSITPLNLFRSYFPMLIGGFLLLPIVHYGLQKIKISINPFTFFIIPCILLVVLKGLDISFLAYFLAWIPTLYLLNIGKFKARLSLIIGLFLISVVILEVYSYHRLTNGNNIGMQFPEIEELDTLQKPKIVLLWSDRCFTCKYYLSILNELAKQNNCVQIVAIEKQFKNKGGEEMNIDVFDPNVINIVEDGTYKQFTGQGFPQLLVLDENHIIQQHYLGANKDILWFIKIRLRQFSKDCDL